MTMQERTERAEKYEKYFNAQDKASQALSKLSFVNGFLNERSADPDFQGICFVLNDIQNDIESYMERVEQDLEVLIGNNKASD